MWIKILPAVTRVKKTDVENFYYACHGLTVFALDKSTQL